MASDDAALAGLGEERSYGRAASQDDSEVSIKLANALRKMDGLIGDYRCVCSGIRQIYSIYGVCTSPSACKLRLPARVRIFIVLFHLATSITAFYFCNWLFHIRSLVQTLIIGAKVPQCAGQESVNCSWKWLTDLTHRHTAVSSCSYMQ